MGELKTVKYARICSCLTCVPELVYGQSAVVPLLNAKVC